MLNNNILCAQVGLVVFGIDTMRNDNFGMDFILQRPCLSSSDNQCHPHFCVGLDAVELVAWINGQGLVLDMGKMNLDSIKSAPPDSQMKEDFGIEISYRIFLIAIDSMQKCIGNCYIFKTGLDSRRGYQMYAKFKILGFNVVDSINHYVKMRFLWVCNRSGYPNLASSGLDTFHLDPPTLNRLGNKLLGIGNHFEAKQYIFKSSGNRFNLPQEYMGKVNRFSVWDLQGKRLAEIKLNKSNSLIQMPKDLRRNGILIVRAEITK
jgi:hypothetical protein